MSAALQWSAPQLRRRLEALTHLLARAGDLLDPVPFRNPQPGWVQGRPALARALLDLDDAALDALELDPDALGAWLSGREPLYARARELARVPAWPTRPDGEPPARLARHVPGRKWEQVRAFTAALDGPEPRRWVEWCAGKGHLGRLLAHQSGALVRCLEREPRLCAAGEQLTSDLPVRFEVHDVTGDDPALQPDEHLVALHACGHLHEALLRHARATPPAGVALAPCCFHLLAPGEAHWRPMSTTGPAAALPMEQARLAVAETATAPRRVRRLRGEERAFRLGFDALQRHRRGIDEPLAIPSVPESLVAQGFAAFCHFAARHRGLELGPDDAAALAPWLGRGRQLDARVRRLDLARAGLRRVLELRMVLDRALVLAEAGYRVGVGTFCARSLSPRNLLIRTLPA